MEVAADRLRHPAVDPPTGREPRDVRLTHPRQGPEAPEQRYLAGGPNAGNVVAYLVGCLGNPATAGRTVDIGGAEVLTYREMMHAYAEARGLPRRVIFRMPLLTPLISVYWVDLVTPVPSEIAHPLIEGLKNEVVCQDRAIDGYVPITRTPFVQAVQQACREETSGPGVRT